MLISHLSCLKQIKCPLYTASNTLLRQLSERQPDVPGDIELAIVGECMQSLLGILTFDDTKAAFDWLVVG